MTTTITAMLQFMKKNRQWTCESVTSE